MMKRQLILALSMAACAWVASPALAQTAVASGTAQMTPDDGLYQALGAKPGLVRLMDDFMQRLLADPRTGPHFKSADQAHLKAQLVEQFCMVAAGPCVYKGPDMKTVHGNLDITKADFHALVEVLQGSMDAQGIAFGVQNKLLARLAPMHRDVITVEN